jgi:hypothetical protein
MSPSSRSVIVPPYCGVPWESHQFPVALVVVAVVVVAVVAVVEVFVVVVVLVVVVVVVDDVVFVVQDAKIIAVTIRQESTIQVIPLFIQTSLLFWDISGKLSKILYPEYF